MYNFASRRVGTSLRLSLRQRYGELVYTQTLTAQSEFPKIPTYRAIDLDGNLLDRNLHFDPAYLTKILKTMVFVDEMDSILLKVKGQGTSSPIQERSRST
jgi:hypothetical protein